MRYSTQTQTANLKIFLKLFVILIPPLILGVLLDTYTTNTRSWSLVWIMQSINIDTGIDIIIGIGVLIFPMTLFNES